MRLKSLVKKLIAGEWITVIYDDGFMESFVAENMPREIRNMKIRHIWASVRNEILIDNVGKFSKICVAVKGNKIF